MTLPIYVDFKNASGEKIYTAIVPGQGRAGPPPSTRQTVQNALDEFQRAKGNGEITANDPEWATLTINTDKTFTSEKLQEELAAAPVF